VKKVLMIIAAILVLTAAITAVLLIVLPKVDVQAVSKATQEPASFSYIIDAPFVTNIKDSDRYAKTQMVLVVNNEDDMLVLKEQSYIVKNVIIGILRNTTEDEFLRSDIQEILGGKIIEGLNTSLPIQGLNEVYFTQLVIQ